MSSLLSELKNIPGIEHVSNMGGNLIGDHGGGGGVDWPGKDHRVEFSALNANYDLMETLGLTMAEGRMFSPKFISDSVGVIFNETAIRQMNLKDPIGQHVFLFPCWACLDSYRMPQHGGTRRSVFEKYSVLPPL